MVYPTAFEVWNREMERLLPAMALNSEYAYPREDQTLYVGCGRRIPFADGWCLDSDPAMGEGMSHFVAGDMLALPFEDGAFRWALSSHTLEHVSEQDCAQALMEQGRVVAVGGLVGAIVPDVRWTAGLDPTHVREWRQDEFVDAHQAINREVDGTVTLQLELIAQGVAEPNYSFFAVWRRVQ